MNGYDLSRSNLHKDTISPFSVIATKMDEAVDNITSEELKAIIESEIRQKIRQQLDFTSFNKYMLSMMDAWLEDQDNVMTMVDSVEASIKKKLQV